MPLKSADTAVTDPKKPGRKPLPPGEKMEVFPIRLTPAQIVKLRAIGVQRLRDWLDRVK